MGRFSKKTLGLLLGLSVLLSPLTPSFSQTLEEQTVLAALALNIVRFTSWPSNVQTNSKETVNFCVIGDNVVQDSFTSIDHKMVGAATLKVINLGRLSNFEQCQVLYVSQLKQNILLQVFVELKKQPVMTIGEGADFAKQGGMVGLENVDNKISLHINLPVVREAELNISARLLQLAKIIDK